MTRDYDPEVQADIELRERSRYDRTRTGGDYAWSRPAIVAHWPCRVCKTPWGVTEEAVEAMDTWNRILRAKDEFPLDSAKVAICDTCRDTAFRARGQRNAERAAEMRTLIRQLKGDPSRDEEVELIRKIRAMNHPDTDALVQAIRERKATKKSRGNL